MLPLVFSYCLRMIQHCCCLPLIEVFVCDGEKRWSHQTLRAAASPPHWRFILSFHLSASPTSRMRDGTQVHSRGWLMTQMWGGRGGHMRLACPWKLMVRGSFALDMSSLGIGAMVGSLAMHKESGTSSISPNLASRAHQAQGKISPWSYLVFDCQTVCNQQASTCSNLDKSTLSDRAGLWIKQQPGKWRGESVASLAGSVLLLALWTLSALIIAVYAVSHLISSYTL